MLEGKILFLTREEYEKQKHLRPMYEAYWVFVKESNGSYTKQKDRWDNGRNDDVHLEICLPSN